MAEASDDQSAQPGQQRGEPKRDMLNLSDERVAEFKKAFAKYDTDDNGTVEASELGPIMRSLGYKPTETDLQEILGPIDKPRISFGEFLALMTKEVQAMSAEDELRQAFEVFDRNGDGLVSCTELRQAMTTLGHKLSLDLVDEMIREADKDGDGKINFDEFVAMLTFK